MAHYQTEIDSSSSRHHPTRPTCPDCGTAMEPSELEQTRTPRLRVGSPVPPRRRLPLWQCSACGIRTPRVDD